MSDDDDAYDKLMQEILDGRSGSPKKSRKEMDEEYSFKRKYDTALKLLLGMAMGRYRYDPNAKKNDAVSQIMQDVEELGYEVSDDTIRDHLKAGYKKFPPQIPRKPHKA